MTRQPTIADAINWDHAAEFSYRDHVTQGVDYVCLFRSDVFTLKAYFFDQGSDDRIVVPHNHRYDFETRLVRGSLREVKYMEHADIGERINRFKYACIVEGGKGFFDPVLVRIVELSNIAYEAGDSWSNQAHVDVHTLKAIEPGTILLQTQYVDVPPMRTLAWARTVPDTSGSYRKMERAQIERRVEELQEALR